MSKTKLSVASELEIKILIAAVSGDLRVRGHERDEIVVDGSRATLSQDEATGQVKVMCQGDMKVNLPARAVLVVESVAGDVRITDMENAVNLGNVSGDLVMRDVGPTVVKNVSADLRIRRIDGDLTVHNVGSDATVQDIGGDVNIGHVGADLLVDSVKGGCEVDHIGSDLVLRTGFDSEKVYTFHVGSDVVCQVWPESDVRFVLPRSANVSLGAEGAELTQEGDSKIVTFGEGAATVALQAGGDVRFAYQAEPGVRVSADLEFNFDFDERLTESLASIEEHLADQLSGLDERLNIVIARQTEKIQQKAERVRQQAEKRAERLRKAAERRAEKEAKRSGWAVTWGAPPAPPASPAPPEPPAPVTDEERLTILRMVESGKISVEEAERLLMALEGKSK